MLKIGRHFCIALGILACIGWGALSVQAETAPIVHIELDAARTPQIGDTFFVAISVSGDTCINAFDLGVTYDREMLELTGTDEGGSAFPFWIDIGSASNGVVRLAGGSLGTCLTHNPSEIIRLAFRAKVDGATTVALESGSILLAHDGKGTHLNPIEEALLVNIDMSEGVVGDAWAASHAEDQEGPEPFTIVLIQAPAILGDGYYIAFYTQDTGSGMASYEVMEYDETAINPKNGLWRPSGYLYALSDQTLESDIYVRAWDKAGNATTVLMTTETAKTFAGIVD